MTEKQKRISDLKMQLLAPSVIKKNQFIVINNNIESTDEDDPMGNKFKRVMDWGTPRLVTKNREL